MDASADEVMDIAQEGHRAYERGDYDEAFRLYRLAADQGDARAQCNLGSMYDFGRGVERSATKARYWYGLAADQGNTHAQDALRQMRP